MKLLLSGMTMYTLRTVTTKSVLEKLKVSTTLELYDWPDAVDWHELRDHVEEKYSINLCDYSGTHSIDGAYKEKERLTEELIRGTPLEGKMYCLNTPIGRTGDWDRDSEEMANRVKISVMRRENGVDAKVREMFPYQNYWHHIINVSDPKKGGKCVMTIESQLDLFAVLLVFCHNKSILYERRK